MSPGTVRYGQADVDEIVSKVVRSVAKEKGVDPMDLTPLHDAIDPDHLVSFLEDVDATTSASFDYCGWQVRVFGDGNIQLQQSPRNE